MQIQDLPEGSPEVAPKPGARHLGTVLDTLVAMHWDLRDGLQDQAELPAAVTERLRTLDRDLDDAIATLKTLIRERGLPL